MTKWLRVTTHRRLRLWGGIELFRKQFISFWGFVILYKKTCNLRGERDVAGGFRSCETTTTIQKVVPVQSSVSEQGERAWFETVIVEDAKMGGGI